MLVSKNPQGNLTQERRNLLLTGSFNHFFWDPVLAEEIDLCAALEDIGIMIIREHRKGGRPLNALYWRYPEFCWRYYSAKEIGQTGILNIARFNDYLWLPRWNKSYHHGVIGARLEGKNSPALSICECAGKNPNLWGPLLKEDWVTITIWDD